MTAVRTLIQAAGSLVLLRWWVSTLLDNLAVPRPDSVTLVAVETAATATVLFALWAPSKGTPR